MPVLFPTSLRQHNSLFPNTYCIMSNSNSYVDNIPQIFRPSLRSSVTNSAPEATTSLQAEPSESSAYLPLLEMLVSNKNEIMQNRTSEPRDLLMSERTFLSWVKCGAMMCLMACLVIVNFRFETSKEDIGGLSPKYNLFIAILLSALGLGCFIVSGISYMQSLHGYKHQKVTTYDSRYTTGYLIILCTALLGVNIAFLIEG